MSTCEQRTKLVDVSEGNFTSNHKTRRGLRVMCLALWALVLHLKGTLDDWWICFEVFLCYELTQSGLLVARNSRLNRRRLHHVWRSFGPSAGTVSTRLRQALLFNYSWVNMGSMCLVTLYELHVYGGVRAQPLSTNTSLKYSNQSELKGDPNRQNNET